jgi:hypothetical protein
VIPEALMTMHNVPFCRYDWTKARAKFVKLHGSIDLLGKPNIVMKGDIQVLPERFEMISTDLWRARTADDALVHTKKFPFGRVMHPSERYNKSPVVIMPPYDPLGYGYRLIQFNWRKAKTALRRTKEVYVIGYSLSEDDEPFRRMMNPIVRSWSPHVTVDVWNPNPEVGERAKKLFGHERVSYHQAKASDFHFK